MSPSRQDLIIVSVETKIAAIWFQTKTGNINDAHQFLIAAHFTALDVT